MKTIEARLSKLERRSEAESKSWYWHDDPDFPGKMTRVADALDRMRNGDAAALDRLSNEEIDLLL
jgi:hypothetical protein